MPTDVDRELNRISATLDRVRARDDLPTARRMRRHREAEVLSRLGRIALADVAIVAIAIGAGLALPAGIAPTG